MMGKVIPEYRPGDKIAFSGFSRDSAIIQLATYGLPNLGQYWPAFLSSFSHLGVVGRYEDKLFVFESTTDDDCPMPCCIAGTRIDGVQAHPIDERVNSYVGKVWHYPLVSRLYDDQIARSTEFLVQYLGTSYDEAGAIGCGFKTWTFGLTWLSRRLSDESLESIYCSEFVAAHDSEIGIFDSDNASLWTPNYLIRYQRRRMKLKRPIRKH